jgi:hypothetical protein
LAGVLAIGATVAATASAQAPSLWPTTASRAVTAKQMLLASNLQLLKAQGVQTRERLSSAPSRASARAAEGPGLEIERLETDEEATEANNAALPFWLSIVLLSLLQGALVAVVRVPATIGRRRPRARRCWALVPPLSVIVFVFAVRASESAGAEGLTYLALIAVPPLAALALARFCAGARPLAALLVVPLFALAWADRGGLAGEGAAVILSALSCIALGALLAAVTPRGWLAAGIVAMAAADATLVASELLRGPNDALNAAHPAAGLPRLQSVVFGSVVMGYGDIFIACALGGLLAGLGRSLQLRGAALAAVLALCFDLLFFAVDELPATVPVAVAVVLVLAARRGAGASRRKAPTARPAGARAPARVPLVP